MTLQPWGRGRRSALSSVPDSLSCSLKKQMPGGQMLGDMCLCGEGERGAGKGGQQKEIVA